MRESGCVSISPKRSKSTLGQGNNSSPPSCAPAAAGESAEAPDNCDLTNCFTSSAVIRPLRPEPCTLYKSTPSSRAKARTDGEACGKLVAGTSVEAKASVGETLLGGSEAILPASELIVLLSAVLGADSAAE